MQTLSEIYEIHSATPSDINEHLVTLRKYASKVSHVTEMGVRWVCSTWGLMAGLPQKMISYDVNPVDPHKLDLLQKLANDNSVDFKFIQANVLDVAIERTDLLFIDTLHSYRQLSLELFLHAVMVNKYIILHDTTTYGHHDEGNVDMNGISQIARNQANFLPRKHGLLAAVEDFLHNNNDWKLCVSYGHNNGLTILERQ